MREYDLDVPIRVEVIDSGFKREENTKKDDEREAPTRGKKGPM